MATDTTAIFGMMDFRSGKGTQENPYLVRSIEVAKCAAREAITNGEKRHVIGFGARGYISGEGTPHVETHNTTETQQKLTIQLEQACRMVLQEIHAALIERLEAQQK